MPSAHEDVGHGLGDLCAKSEAMAQYSRMLLFRYTTIHTQFTVTSFAQSPKLLGSEHVEERSVGCFHAELWLLHDEGR